MDIGIIGCGIMGSAFAVRLAPLHPVTLFDRTSQKAQVLANSISSKSAASASEVAKKADILILAVKPHQLHDVAEEIEADLKEDGVVMSMLVGVSLASLQDRFPRSKVVRVMPNLSIRCGKGIVAVAEPLAAPQSVIRELFHDFGSVAFVPEELFHAIGVLAGSGPAYIFLIIEALVEAGIAMGIASSDAKRYALEMIEGAVALLQESDDLPERLKWSVSAPGGTTIAGLREMEKRGVKSGIIEGLLASFDKSHSFEEEAR